MYRKKFFTLVEVLITLAIIGIIASLTLPSLFTKITAKIKQYQLTVIEKRLVEGLNLYNTLENSLSGRQYIDTYDFLQGLSKYFKMSAICVPNN